MSVHGEHESENEGGGPGEREVVAIEVAAAPDAVWSALRDLTQVHRWFGWEYDGLDAEIRQIFATAAIEGSDGGTRTLSWADGDAISLAPAGDGTHLVIARRGRPGAAADASSHADGNGEGDGDGDGDGPDQIDEGWTQFAQQLRFVLERNPQGPRRTVSAIDLDGGPSGVGPVYRLGVAASDGIAVGEHWEVSREIGDGHDMVGGTIWYRSHFQAGYTVEDPSGDALLVVRRVPVAQRPPHGRVSLVMSTYGLDDETFAAVERRWTTWWSGS